MRKGILAIGSAFILVTLHACSSGPKVQEVSKEEKANIMVDAARAALSENDPTSALIHLNEAEKYDGKSREVAFVRALAFYKKSDLSNALTSARQAVALNPTNSAGNNLLGKILLDQGQLSDAEKYLQKAARDPLNPESYLAKTNLGILYYRSSKWVQSETQFNSAISDNAQMACVAYYYRGHLKLKKEKFQSAISDYDLASKNYCGNFPEAHLALGIAFTKSKRYDLARRKFLEIKEMFPESKIVERAMNELRELP